MSEYSKISRQIIADLVILGITLSLISFFLPFYTIGNNIVYGFNLPLVSIFLIVSVVFGYMTAYKIYKNPFYEEIIKSRKYLLISAFSGALSAFLFISDYLITIFNNQESIGGIGTPLTVGIGFVLDLPGLVIILIGLIVLNRTKKLFPIKYPETFIKNNPRSVYKKVPLINTELIYSGSVNKLNCPNCGNILLENQIFCSNCGNRRK